MKLDADLVGTSASGESVMWTRRKALVTGGAVALNALVGCGAGGMAARPVAQRGVPWVAQFLIEVGANVFADKVSGFIDDLGAREERLALGSMEIVTDGGFTVDCTTEHGGGLLANGVGNIVLGPDFKGYCRVDPNAPHETCIGMWRTDANRSFALLEGPVLGALHGVATTLLAEGWSRAAIAEATVPRFSHAMGGGLRFSSEQALRKYRTDIGDMTVSWVKRTKQSGVARVDIPGAGELEIDNIPFLQKL